MSHKRFVYSARTKLYSCSLPKTAILNNWIMFFRKILSMYQNYGEIIISVKKNIQATQGN